ncbi:MAG: hypothetical protein M1607_04910 [Patescibacteria group bacterium]|nr:hypothetical protein [Patescibacteria group bacterium]
MRSNLLPWVWVLAIIFVFAVFWTESFYYLDPDFGWHLKMGQLIINSGVPQTDPFSYTMPSFPFIDHEWFSDVVIYKIYQLAGRSGLATIYSLIALTSLLILIPEKKKLLSLGVFLLGAAVLLSFVGIRPQVQSWLLWSLELLILFKQVRFAKIKFALPFLFLIWVNLHGSFAIGLILLGVALLVRLIQHKLVISDLIVFILSTLATSFNPYGLRIWVEIWRSFSDASLHWSIAEWTPTLIHFYPAIIFFIASSTALLVYNLKKIPLLNLCLYSVLLVAGLSSIRHIPLWLVIAIPNLLLSIQLLFDQIGKDSTSLSRLNYVINLFVFNIVQQCLTQSKIMVNQIPNFSEQAYPQQAVIYLTNHPTSNQLFAPYQWGGYLIWQLPQQKDFIDGRMPSWRWNAPVGESNYAFKDYQEMTTNKQALLDNIKKYHIQTVLWPVPQKTQTNLIDQLTKPITTSLRLLLHLQNNSQLVQPSYSIPDILKESGWQITYQDSVAVILIKQP